MTSKILFRGFYEKYKGTTTIIVDGKEVSGEWIYGYYVKFRMNKENPVAHYIQQLREDRCLYIMQEVIPCTVGQYTGVDEIDGKKIFASDKCTFTDDFKSLNGDIKIEKGCFYFKDSNGKLTILNELLRYRYKIEVIGTIFDKEVAKCDK